LTPQKVGPFLFFAVLSFFIIFYHFLTNVSARFPQEFKNLFLVGLIAN
jgi:hypothetical protein